MKKRNLKAKLYLGKSNIVSFTNEHIKGGTGNTADCPPPTKYVGCITYTCHVGSNNCGTNSCNTMTTCLTDMAASCTPRGCGNTLYVC